MGNDAFEGSEVSERQITECLEKSSKTSGLGPDYKAIATNRGYAPTTIAAGVAGAAALGAGGYYTFSKVKEHKEEVREKEREIAKSPLLRKKNRFYLILGMVVIVLGALILAGYLWYNGTITFCSPTDISDFPSLDRKDLEAQW